ncbi:MAG TPA: hypothetical protein VGC15_13405 [Acetobacteraceae bacterium]
MARIGVLIGLLALPGCSSLLSEGSADVAGIAGAAAASSVTSSAAAAAAIGLGVRSLAAEGVKYTARRVHRTEQDAIAGAAGPLDPGTAAPWQVKHSLPLEPDAAGQVVVSRAFGAGAFRCKEIVFSVDKATRTGTERSFYTATVCQDGLAWRWASAEPAVARWGGLQ